MVSCIQFCVDPSVQSPCWSPGLLRLTLGGPTLSPFDVVSREGSESLGWKVSVAPSHSAESCV